MSYLPRVVDTELAARLASMGAVVVEGPKACGKTETARQVAASEVLLDIDENARRAVEIDPTLVLSGATPRLLDEWQLVPRIWDQVRRAVDSRKAPGQFILTGSAFPADAITRHTGAGRIARLRMRPMTLSETGHSNRSVSLAHLLAGLPPSGPDPGLTLPDLVARLCAGGWPAMQHLSVLAAVGAMRDYVDEIIRVELPEVEDVRSHRRKLPRVLQSLARHVATAVKDSTIIADVIGPDIETLDRRTVAKYLGALERLMIVEDQPAWAPHLRSKARLRTSPKHHFVDPAIAVAALRATPETLRRDLKFLGFLFESLVVRDLRVYAQACDAQVHYYQDNVGLEVDAIVAAADGRWAGFEVKLGGSAIDEAAGNLCRLRDSRVNLRTMGPPAILAVIVATGYAYLRADGVAVIPVGTLTA